MKKSVKFIITILMITLIVFGITFSVKAIHNEKINDDKQIKKMNILDNDVTAKYSYSYDNIDVYIDEHQTEYLVKDDTNFGFIKELPKSNLSKNSKITQEQALTKGREFINSKISNFNDYTLSSSNYNNNYGEYSFIFIKKLLNYDTMDLIFVAVSSEGNITAFYSVNSGEFDSYNNIVLNESNITDFINQEINEKYFTQVKYISELGRTFKKENNELILEIVIQVSLKDGTTIADSLLYHI